MPAHVPQGNPGAKIHALVDSQLHPLLPIQGTLDKSPRFLGCLEMSPLLSLLRGLCGAVREKARDVG